MRTLFLLSWLGLLPVSAFAFTVDDVAALVQQDTSIQTAEDLIAKLPEDLRTAPVLMYRSQSQQEASAVFPRAILMGPGGDSVSVEPLDRLFLAFNGDPSQRNYQAIEMIQYRREKKAFEFSKVLFSSDRRPQYVTSPPECIRCHDYPGHPNWSPYPFWPGAYPSSDGFSESGSKEEGFYSEFYQTNASKGRYRFLKLKAPKDMENNSDIPTTRLANLFSDLSNVTVAAQILATRNYGSYKFATAAALKSCPDLDTFVPEALRKRFARDSATVLTETKKQQLDSFHARIHDQASLTNPPFAPDLIDGLNFSDRDVPAVAGLRYVMERDGSSLIPWIYAFDKQSWSATRSQFDGVIYELSRQSDEQIYYEACADLLPKSLEALNKLLAQPGDALSSGIAEGTLVGDRSP